MGLMGRRPEATHYTPKNPEKYKGDYPIVARSGWERSVFQDLDSNEFILEWASEPMSIPYFDPVTGRQRIYIPDILFMGVTADMKGTKTVLVEIKPAHEALIERARSDADSLVQATNMAKWAAASWWCERRGIEFRVVTEDDLFGGQSVNGGTNRAVTNKALKQKRTSGPKPAQKTKPGAKAKMPGNPVPRAPRAPKGPKGPRSRGFK